MYLGIDIGGTSIKYALFNKEGGKVTDVMKTPTIKDEASNQILQTVLNLVGKYQKKIEGVAISSAGVVNSEGSIAYAGYTIPGYTGTKIKKEFEASNLYPTKWNTDKVTVSNKIFIEDIL